MYPCFDLPNEARITWTIFRPECFRAISFVRACVTDVSSFRIS